MTFSVSQPSSRQWLALFIGLALLAAGVVGTYWRSVISNAATGLTGSAPGGHPVTAAWEKARASGSYQFTSDVTQVTLPVAKVTNAGRSSRTERFQLNGTSDVRANTLEMQLLADSDSAFARQSGTWIKVDNGVTSIRRGNGDWQVSDELSTGTAPEGDYLGYLRAVRNLTRIGAETRAGIHFTRYTFTIDGPTYAGYVRDQMELSLRAKGELPSQARLEIPRYYLEMIGSGELWIRDDGLPLRQILELQFPEQKDSYVTAQVTVTFSKFGQSNATYAQLWHARDWTSLGQTLASHLPNPTPLLALLGMTFCAVLIVQYRQQRAMQRVLATAVIASMVLAPLISALELAGFYDAQRARAATQAEQSTRTESIEHVRNALGNVEFNPHQNPLASTTNNPLAAKADDMAATVERDWTNVLSSPPSALPAAPVSQALAAAVTPPSGMTNWWTGDGNATDIRGGQAGSLSGSTAFAAGQVGQAFSFNGSNGYVALPANAFGFPTSGTSTTPFSFELWFKTAGSGVILGQQAQTPYAATTSAYVPAIYIGTDGKLRVEMFWRGTLNPVVSASAVNNNVFHHVAVVYSGSTQIVYLDGVAIVSIAHTQTAYNATYQYQLGTGFTTNWPGGLSGWANFTGLIDEPTLYNRALSAAEIQAIVAAAGNGKVKPTSTDMDSDGLSNIQERSIGTDTEIADTDEDLVPDGVEARGFTLAGKSWYLNANEIDSNGDSIGDGLECWRTPPATTTPTAPACDLDTDGDGRPDLFDEDNDNDGATDRVDQAPFVAATATYSEGTPFQLTVNNLTVGKPTFVDFQIRPTVADRLWHSNNVLDWPQDNAGQVQDIDRKTFAAVAASQGRLANPNDANGNMRLLPMLELRITGSTTNLPTQAELLPYDILVNNYTADGNTKVVYVPLTVQTDEKNGERVAFSGRMRYLPSGSWPSAHDVRLVWNVQVLNDIPCDPTNASARAAGCTALAGNASVGYYYNVPQVVQTYYDDFKVTGLSVYEDNGASVATIYEDPAVDANKKDDGALWSLSHGLDNSFLVGRDQDSNGQRDVNLNEIARRFDRLTNGGVSETQRWAIPNVLRVEKKDYATLDYAAVATAMTETVRILNSQFSSTWQADKTVKPLLLFADEARFRKLNLDGAGGAGGYVTLNNAGVTFNFAPAGQSRTELIVKSGLRWTPFCAPTAATPTWNSCETDVYWNELSQRHPDSIVLPGGSEEAEELTRIGNTVLMQLYMLSLRQGVNRIVQREARIVSAGYKLKSDSETEVTVRTGLSVAGSAVKSVAKEIIFSFKAGLNVRGWLAFKFIDVTSGSVGGGIFKTLTNFTGSLRNGLAGSAIVAGALGLVAGVATTGLAAFFPELFPDPAAAELGGQIALKTIIIGISTYFSVISPIKAALTSADELDSLARAFGQAADSAAKVAGVIGAVIGTTVTWGFFVYSVVDSQISAFSPEFNKAFAEALAATIYIIVTTAIAATVIGGIVIGIIDTIDAILTAACLLDEYFNGSTVLRLNDKFYAGSCFSISTTATKVIAYLLYNYDVMIDTDHRDANGNYDVILPGSPDITLANPQKGLITANPMTVTIPVTTTAAHKSPDPSAGLYINLYLYFFSPDNLRSTTIRHNLSQKVPVAQSVQLDQMKTEWSAPVVDHNYVATPLYRATNVTALSAKAITLPVGLNRTPDLYLNSNFALPAYECVGIPNIVPFYVPPVIPVCYTRSFATTNATKLDSYKLDVFPNTLSEFITLTSRQFGTLSMSWDAQFPPLNDADGDGLLTTARGGLDPNDATWDHDKDGLADTYELQRREQGVPFSPLSCDSDLDGLTDKQEAELGSNPATADTDNDGIKDGDEVWHQLYNPSTCQPTGNWSGGWDVPVNDGLTVHVSSNLVAFDGDGDSISDLAEKQLAGRIDSNKVAYHPNVINAPPLTVYTSLSDSDHIVAPGQSLRYTTTVVASEPMLPGVLEVLYAGGAPTYRMNFNANTFNGSQSVTQTTQLQAPTSSAQSYVITSTARTRLAISRGPEWVFEPVITEPPLPGVVSTQRVRQVALTPARSDRQDSYRLTAVSGQDTTIVNAPSIVGDVLQYNLSGGQPSSGLDEDGNNRLAARENFPAQIATNDRGISLAVWRDFVFAGTVVHTPYKPNSNGFVTDLGNAADTLAKLDINGDGKDDFLWYRPGGGFAGVYLSNGDGTVTYKPYKNGPASANQNGFASDLASTADRFVPIDANGDGKDDILFYRPGGGWAGLYLSNGDGSLTYKPYKSGATSANQNGFASALNSINDTLAPLDINGDGKDDILWYQPGGGFAGIHLSNGDGSLTFKPYKNGPASAAQNGFGIDMASTADRLVPMDINGDSKDDLFFYRPGGGFAGIHLANGDGSLQYLPYATPTQPVQNGFRGLLDIPDVSFAVLDQNNDGRDDLLYYRRNDGRVSTELVGVHLSNGDGTLSYITYLGTSGANVVRGNGFVDLNVDATDRALPLDLNGDGWDDLLWYRPGGNLAGVYLVGRQQISAALLDSAGNLQKRFALPRNPSLPRFGLVSTFQPMVASDGENFLVAYEAGMNSGPDRKDYLAMQSFNASGVATGSSAVPVNATDQTYSGPSRFQAALTWVEDRYRIAMQVRDSGTIAVRDFSPTAAPLFDIYVEVANNGRTTNPALALAAQRAGWLLAYATPAGIDARAFLGANSYTAGVSKTLASGDPLQVMATYNQLNFNWLVGWYNSSKQLQLAPFERQLTALTPVQPSFSVDQFPSTALACPAIKAAPVAELRFEELPGTTNFEESALVRNVSCSGASCPQAGVAGATYPNGSPAGDPASYYAVRFDGVDDVLTLNTVVRNNFSVAFWVKTPTVTVPDAVIIDQGGDQPGGYIVRLNNGRPEFLLNTHESIISPTRIDDNRWHSVVATHDRSTGKRTLYVDGVVAASLTIIGTLPMDNVNDIRIGSARTNNRRFSGNLDQLQLYDIALGADMVKALYDRTSQSYCVAASPTTTGTAVQWAKLKVYRAEYRGGGITAVSALNYIVDTDIPTSTVTSVQNNQYVKAQPNAQQTVIVGGRAGDRTAGVARVEVNVNNGGWQTASGLESWSWPLVVGPEGVYNVRSRATDGVGTVETVGTGVNVIVDGAAPTGALTNGGASYPPNNPPLLVKAIRQGNGQFNVPVSGSASDPAIGGQGGSGVQRIEVRLAGTSDSALGNGWQSVTAPLAGNQWTLNYLFAEGQFDPTGTYSVTLRLTDKVDNQRAELFVGRINVDARGPSAILTQSNAALGVLTNTITSTVNIAGQLTENGFAGIDKADVAFVPVTQAATLTDTIQNWLPATLSQRGAGVTSANWSRAVPNLEGIYQIDVNGRDMLSNIQLTGSVWRGLIDNVAPRVTLSGRATGQSYLDTATNTQRYEIAYTCRAADFQLYEATFNCAGNGQRVPVKSFNNDPLFKQQFPDLTLLTTLVNTYTVWAASPTPTGSLTACDAYGHCTTANATSTGSVAGSSTGSVAGSSTGSVAGSSTGSVAGSSAGSLTSAAAAASTSSATAAEPQTAILAPTAGSVVNSTGTVQVSVAAQADQPLKELVILLDNTPVSTIAFAQRDNVKHTVQTASVTVATAGTHTLAVRATDWSGVQSQPVPVSFVVDRQAPVIALSNSQLTKADSYGAQTNILRFRGTASDDTGLASVQLKVGDQPYADASFGEGKWQIAYPVTDPEGKPLTVKVRSRDAAGNVTEISQILGTDLSVADAPDTTLGNKPTAPSGPPSNSTSAGFTFTGSATAVAFECQVDDAPALPCVSPWALTDLSNGSHTVKVAAINAQGFPDLTPASHTWTVNVTTLATTLTAKPEAATTSRAASFSFTANGVGSFECALDGGSYTPCASPKNYDKLGNGNHTFLVRAKGSAGSPTNGPATRYIWRVNNAAPTVVGDQVLMVVENSAVNVTLQSTDSDALTFQILEQPQHGFLLGLAPNLTYVPNTGYAGPDRFTYRAWDGEAASAPATVNITVRLGKYAVFAGEGVAFEQNSVVVRGDVGVNAQSAGPFLRNNVEASFSQNSLMQDPTSRVLADSIVVDNNGVIYNPSYNDLTGKGVVNGVRTTPLALPLRSGLPALPTITPGTQAVAVNGSQTLAAGSYGAVTVNNGATLVLSGGLYHFAAWNVGQGAKVHFQAPSEVRIAGALVVNQNGFVGPAPGVANLDANSIVIHVAGTDGQSGPGNQPRSAAFDQNVVVTAYIVAPNGMINFRQNVNATGAFIGKWLLAEQNSKVTRPAEPATGVANGEPLRETAVVTTTVSETLAITTTVSETPVVTTTVAITSAVDLAVNGLYLPLITTGAISNSSAISPALTVPTPVTATVTNTVTTENVAPESVVATPTITVTTPVTSTAVGEAFTADAAGLTVYLPLISAADQEDVEQ